MMSYDFVEKNDFLVMVTMCLVVLESMFERRIRRGEECLR